MHLPKAIPVRERVDRGEGIWMGIHAVDTYYVVICDAKNGRTLVHTILAPPARCPLP